MLIKIENDFYGVYFFYAEHFQAHTARFPAKNMYIRFWTSYDTSNPKPSPTTTCHEVPNFLSSISWKNYWTTLVNPFEKISKDFCLWKITKLLLEIYLDHFCCTFIVIRMPLTGSRTYIHDLQTAWKLIK